jgi:hypothetical protein
VISPRTSPELSGRGAESETSRGSLGLKSIGRFTITAATAACLLLGAVSVLEVVGWTRLLPSAEGPPRPIAFDDYALQFYYGQLGSRFLREGGVTYGYDPNFMAGYPKSPVYYPSSKPYELSLYLFSGCDSGTVFNWTVFSMLAVLPLLMYAAARNFGASAGERLAVVALSLVPHHLFPMVDFYSIMEAAGMVPFIFASFLSVYVVSLMYRFLSVGGRLGGLALLATAPILYLSHLAAVFISAVPIATIYLARLRSTPARRHLWLWLVLLTIVAANWHWIEGYALFSHYADLRDFYTKEGREQFAPAGGWLALFRMSVLEPRIVSLAPALFGTIGLYLWWRERQLERLAIFSLQILFLFVVVFHGVQLGLSALAPGRMTLPLALYLFFPAAHALAAVASKAAGWIRHIAPSEQAAQIAIAVSAALVLGAGVISMQGKFLRPYALGRLEEREGFTEHGMALIEWLRDNTDAKGRILHEETNRKSHRYYGSHMPSWIPLYAGREMAGGPAPHALLQHNFLRFIAGTFRGRPLRHIAPDRLASYLSLYNVRWVLAWKPATKRHLMRLPFATHTGEFDKFTLFRIEIPPSYFLRGSGHVEVDGSRIHLRDVTPQDGRVAIKYHWLETLRTDPPRSIAPLYMLDDPVPFISIEDPPREIVIYNDFDYGLLQAGN